MPSNHLIPCHPLLLLSSISPRIRVFSNESALRMRWPKYWSFSFNISPSNEHLGLISFRMDSIQSAKIRPGADCGSDHELLIAKYRLKLKKVGKTTRPFRYDLNQWKILTVGKIGSCPSVQAMTSKSLIQYSADVMLPPCSLA